MHRALETLGIRPGQKVSIDILLSETFNGNLYGMGEDQMAKVKALRDILAEYESSHKTPGRTIKNSRDAAEHLFDTLKGLGHEEVWVMYLNSGNAVIGKEQMYKGSLSESTFSCRDVIARTLSANAAGLILFHNHPSGNPAPSASDVKRTEELQNACKTVGLNLVDHIIISTHSWYSFADESETKYNR